MKTKNNIFKSRSLRKALTRKNLAKIQKNHKIEKVWFFESRPAFQTLNGRKAIAIVEVAGNSYWCENQNWNSLIARDFKTKKFFHIPLYSPDSDFEYPTLNELLGLQEPIEEQEEEELIEVQIDNKIGELRFIRTIPSNEQRNSEIAYYEGKYPYDGCGKNIVFISAEEAEKQILAKGYVMTGQLCESGKVAVCLDFLYYNKVEKHYYREIYSISSNNRKSEKYKTFQDLIENQIPSMNAFTVSKQDCEKAGEIGLNI